MAAVKIGSGKEVQAVTVNVKEERLLDKTLQTLELEQAYTLKLIHLDRRELKFTQKQMQQSVGKIRSHLSPVEIATFRIQEIDGKFQAPYQSVNVSGSLRIAAAAKRLKLQADIERAEKRKLQRIPRQELVLNQRRKPLLARISSDMTSLDGNDIKTDVSPRWPTGNVGRSPSRPSVAVPGGIRPATSQGFSQLTQAASPRPKTVLGYSSHNAKRIDAPEDDAGTKYRSTRKLSISSNSSADLLTARDRADEIRQELLDEELRNLAAIEIRRKQFLDRTSSWNKENQVLSFSKSKGKLGCGLEQSDGGVGKSKRITFSRAAGEPDPAKSGFLDAWKDLKKCRYLRIKQEDVDLSGVNTLAVEHMKLYTSLARRSNKFPLDIAPDKLANCPPPNSRDSPPASSANSKDQTSDPSIVKQKENST